QVVVEEKGPSLSAQCQSGCSARTQAITDTVTQVAPPAVKLELLVRSEINIDDVLNHLRQWFHRVNLLAQLANNVHRFGRRPPWCSWLLCVRMTARIRPVIQRTGILLHDLPHIITIGYRHIDFEHEA